MNQEQQQLCLIGVIGWLLLRQYSAAQRTARIELLLRQICKKLEIEV